MYIWTYNFPNYQEKKLEVEKLETHLLRYKKEI